MSVMVLEGGIKGWVKSGPRYTALMDGYKPEYWEKLFAEEEETAKGKDEPETTKTAVGGDVTQ